MVEIPRQTYQRVVIWTAEAQTRQVLPPPPRNPSKRSQFNTRIDPKSHPVTFLIPKTRKAATRPPQNSVLGTRNSVLFPTPHHLQDPLIIIHSCVLNHNLALPLAIPNPHPHP